MLNFLKSLARKYLRKRRGAKICDMLTYADMSPVSNERTGSLNKVAFVLPAFRMSEFGGGTTSVFRLADGLGGHGFDVCVTLENDEFYENMRSSVHKLFPGLRAKAITNAEFRKTTFDCVIATSWETAYYVKSFPGYKMYFVQDYEPYFNERGDLSYLAEKTYGFGYHMVSLGGWNRKKIAEVYPDARIDHIGFPFDGSNYKPVKRQRITDKKTVKAAVYLRNTPRRLPFVTEWLCRRLTELFAADGKTLEVNFFGDDMKMKTSVGKNLGPLGWKDLAVLYEESDFGIVFSYTNISLVPYEMMATGLPLVELKEGTFTEFMPERSAVLFDGDCEKTYAELLLRLTDADLCEKIDAENRALLAARTWDETVRGFAEILKG